ncbi:MAG: SUMF1/EgtB/PvdO family nonheme iron enzyme, partial [Pirellulaceae bacterium]|nr:SUMF1/EgtB/PvdO family nonheme iron enzyme [Pirellulaceae bacterium]
ADALKQKMADADKAQQERAAARLAAESSAQDAQKILDEKTASVTAAKKAAEEALGGQKQREQARQEADAAAEEAQKIAADKARLAAAARKAVEDNAQQVQDQQALQQRVEGELRDLQKIVSERRKAAEEAAKTLAAAEAAREQQAQAAQQAAREMAQAQESANQARVAEQSRKAALEVEAARSERAKVRERLSAQAAAAQKAAEEAARLVAAALKEEEDAERAVKEGGASAMLPGPAPLASLPVRSTALPSPTPGASPSPVSVRAPGTKMRLETALENGLGMKFAPVGDVLFCVWQTRIRDFEAFAKATNHKSSAWRQPGFKQGPDHPVVNVSWNEGIAFCKWLTEKEQKEGLLGPTQAYRLPTDMEWSKAVGLPDETGRTPEARDMDVPDVYPWGTAWPPPAGAGNYTGEETGSDVAIKGYDDGFAWTAPVGSFKPNKFGLYDMGGNVWQWCMDWLNAEQKAKVLRGGSWYNGALKLSLLSSCRYHSGPDSSTDNFGFRVVVGTGGKR